MLSSTLRSSVRHARFKVPRVHLEVAPRRNFTKWHENLHFPAGIRSKLSPTVLVMGFIPIFTFALGTWQVRRRRWKLDLIDQLNDQIHREPLELPDSVNLDILPEFDFRGFIVKGEWDHAHTILLGPKTRDGTLGYQVIAPLVRQGGTTILIDRGFVSKDHVSNHQLQGVYQPQGLVTVLGMLRTQVHRKNMFTPENIPEKGEWHSYDLERMIEWLGGEKQNVQPVFLEEIFNGNAGQISDMVKKGIPVGRPSEIELRNMHATYAITWFSLSAATTLMFIGLLRRKRAPPARFI